MAHEKGKGKRTGKGKGNGDGKDNGGTTQISLPTTKVVRKPTAARHADAYVIDSNKKYIIGLTSKRSNMFLEVVTEMVDKFNDGNFKTKEDATCWLDEQVS